MTKIKIFENQNIEKLAAEVNEWLSDEVVINDIKYKSTSAFDEDGYWLGIRDTVLIIYEDK